MEVQNSAIPFFGIKSREYKIVKPNLILLRFQSSELSENLKSARGSPHTVTQILIPRI